MAERYEAAEGNRRVLRLRTDDGPIAELVIYQDAAAIDVRLSVYEASPSPLAVMASPVLREQRGAVDKVARLVLKATPDPEDLWTFIGTQYAKHATRWEKASLAANQAADAAVATAPEADRAAIVRAIVQSTMERLP